MLDWKYVLEDSGVNKYERNNYDWSNWFEDVKIEWVRRVFYDLIKKF